MKWFGSSKISLMLIGLLGLASVSLAAEDTWTTKADMPTARHVLSSSVVDGKIYAIGGSPGNCISIVEKYDPATDTWTRKADMPMSTGAASSSTVNGRIYVMGGVPSWQAAPYSSVQEYDATTDAWTAKANMPTARAWLSSSVVNGKIYVIGGASAAYGTPFSTVEEYDPATDTWTSKADMPTARACLSTSAVNGKIYAIGGTPSNPWYQGLSTVEEYNPAANTWTKKADMPTGRTYISTCAVNGKIYAIGGWTTGSNHLSSVEEYDPATDTWTRKADMPTARYALTTSAVNGKIYAIGGWAGTDISTVEEYTPPSPVIDFNGDGRVDFKDFSILAKCWLQYSSLVDIAPPSNIVDIKDLGVFAENWLIGTRQASNPHPWNGATNVDINADLSWTPGDGAALHEVYFGSDLYDLPLVATQPVGQDSYDPPGDLIPGTTYYWWVDEVNDAGPPPGKWPGVLWSFTTVRGQAHTPSPADDAAIPGTDGEWPSGNFFIYTSLDVVPGPTADPDPSVRRAYFSKNRDDVVNRIQDANLGPPPYMDPCCYQPDPDSYIVGLPASVYEMDPYAIVPETGLESLERGEVYYWCVDEADADGRTFGGDIWEFTIQGFYAFEPSPPNDAILVDPNVVLSWGEGYGVSEHDIYLGTSWDDVNNADASDATGIYRSSRKDPNYPCSNLELTTKFYWRIDEVQGRLPPLFPGIIYKGDVWSFTTGDPLPP